MTRKASLSVAAAILAAGFFAGCASDQGGERIAATGSSNGYAGAGPVMYGTDGNRSGTVPPSHLGTDKTNNSPEENVRRMGWPAYSGGTQDAAGAVKPATAPAGAVGTVELTPENTNGAVPAGSTIAPGAGTTGTGGTVTETTTVERTKTK